MTYRFTGHETFPCRYPWLPKAVKAIDKYSDLFTDIDTAIMHLGVGKQMVSAIKFWVEAAKFAEKKEKGDYIVSPLGNKILGKNGHDPFLENTQTLWLIHWNFSNHPESPIFAWDFLMNRWQDPEIFPPEVIQSFKIEAEKNSRNLSWVTLKQHFNIFLHSYVPKRGKKAAVLEDNLDCPLTELDLIQQIGETVSESNGKREKVYAFNREPKPQISQQLFCYCLVDFWDTNFSEEQSIQFRDVASGHGGPGQIFKLPEQEIHRRLEEIGEFTDRAMIFRESANIRQVQKHNDIDKDLFLNAIYKEGK